MLKFKPVFTPYLFLFPALLMLTLTVFWPALQAFYLSLFSYDLLTPPEWVGLKNFQRLWTDRNMGKWLTSSNTCWWIWVRKCIQN